VAALAAAGWEPVEVAPADECPDAVFVEDVLVVHAGIAVLTRPGAAERRPELTGAEETACSLGLRLGRIEPPGTLDGGDVLVTGEAVYVGTGGRTNAEGARQLGAVLGRAVRAVPVSGVLHLKSAVTALPDGTLVGHPATALLPECLAVPEPSGANIAVLGPQSVLVAADCPRSAELYASLGFEPVVVEIGELQKLEGGVTCLSVLIP
jgi:dimethylargininase